MLRDGLNNPEALGSYVNGVISYIKDPHNTTLPHETFHATMAMAFSTKESQEALAIAREESGMTEMTDLEAEEYLAQKFANWYVNRQDTSITARLKRILARIKDFMLRLNRDSSKLETLFKTVISEETAQSIKSFEDAGGINQMRSVFNQNPEIFTTEFQSNEQLWKKGTQKRVTVISAINKIRKPIMKDYLISKLETEFDEENIIDMEEFKRAIMDDMLKIDIIASTTYADYGLNNIGVDMDMIGNQEYKTYILNTNFEHGVKGHFSSDFDIRTTKEDLEIRELKGTHYVVRKDLSADSLESGVFDTFTTAEKAQTYIDKFADRTVEQAGMIAHYRAFEQADDFNVVEMQSDVFQKDLTKLKRDKENLLARNILKAQEEPAELEALIKTLDFAIKQLEGIDYISDDDAGAYQAAHNIINIKTVYRPGEKWRIKKLVDGYLDMDVENYSILKNVLEEPNNSASGENIRLIDKKARELRVEIKDKLPAAIANISKIEKEGITRDQKQEIALSKQFLSLKNNYHEQIINHAIRQAASNGSETIRFATPMTVAFVEGYVEDVMSDFSNEYRYSKNEISESDLYTEGRNHLGEDGIITDINDLNYTVVSTYTNTVPEFYTREDIIEKFPDAFKKGNVYSEKDALKLSIEEFSLYVFEQDTKNFQIHETSKDNFEILAAISDMSGNSNINDFVFEKLSISTDSYKTGVELGSFQLSDIQDSTQRTIAEKYGINEDGKEGVFYKYMKKKRSDLQEVTDDNGFTWWESKIMPNDKAAVELFQTKDQLKSPDELQKEQVKMNKAESKQELRDIIAEKTFKNEDSLRKALNLPAINNMTVKEIEFFKDVVKRYNKNDDFLSKKMIETSYRTDYGQMETKDELEAAMLADGLTKKDLETIDLPELHKFANGLRLSRHSNLLKYVVDNIISAEIETKKSALNQHKKIQSLANKARRSRIKKQSVLKTISQTVIPTDDVVFGYIEAFDKTSYARENDMTKEEIAYGNEVIAFNRMAYQHLSENYDFTSRFGEFKEKDYMVHIRRGFLEAVKDSGIKKAFGEVLSDQREAELAMSILDGKTGQIVPFEKWSPYMQFREGDMRPTMNVAKAHLVYVNTFFRKQNIDKFVPKLMMVLSLRDTLLNQTDSDIKIDGGVKGFIKQYINNARGRKIDGLGFIRQGSKFEAFLHQAISATTLLALGGRLAVGLSSAVGEFVATTTSVITNPSKLATGLTRMFDTKKSKEVFEKQKHYIGLSPIEELLDPTKNIPEKLVDILMILFSIGRYQSHKFALKAGMTKEQWRRGELTNDELRELAKEQNKFKGGSFDQGSLQGSTVVGRAFSQYLSWAFNIATTVASSTNRLIGVARKEGISAAAKSEYMKDLKNYVSMAIIMAILASQISVDDEDKENKTMLYYIQREMNTLVSAFPALLLDYKGNLKTTIPILEKSKSLFDIISSFLKNERYNKDGKDYVEGDSKALVQAKRFITPTALKRDGLDKKYKGVEDRYEKLVELKKEGKTDEIKELLKTFSDDEYELINELKESDDEKAFEKFKKSKEMKSLFKELESLKEEGDKEKLKDELDALTDEEYKAIKSLQKEEDAKEESQLLLSIKGVLVDPMQVLKGAFSKEDIEKVEKSKVVFKRMGYEPMGTGNFEVGESQEKKKDMMKEAGIPESEIKDYKLEHIVPLTVGGTNSEKNLRLVTTEEWNSYTPIDVKLGNAVRDGKLSRRKASSLAKDFKNGIITSDEVLGEIK
ncbi:MAG: hypothetical protein ACTSQE_14370 [Candidatus Heimdallarchaeaceae archaeon]